MIVEKDFISNCEDSRIRLITLENDSQLKIQLTNYGARIVAMYFPDKDEKIRDIVLGYNRYIDYLKSNEIYYGAAIGPYTNRIGGAKFHIEGTEYLLDKNNGSDILHGGSEGFHNAIWQIDEYSTSHVIMVYRHPDGTCGFPGNILTKIHFELGDDSLRISFRASSNRISAINLTHHSFFNLKGEGNGNILDHEVEIHADMYNEVSEHILQTGSLLNVVDSPFDLRKPVQIAERIQIENEQLKRAKGFDHNFVLNTAEKCAASIYSPHSGIKLEVFCSHPGMQFYTGNFLDGSDFGKSRNAYLQRSAICLEPQHFPDSVNFQHFPSTLYKVGEEYSEWMEYKLSNK